jgi:adenosylcobinamide-GDP ribazoletransferase
MTLAPVVGLGLGLVMGAVLLGFRTLYHDPRLASALTIAVLALLTGGLHLDGLADTADGLGASSRGRVAALDVMRRGDVGPFGVVTLVLVLVLQVLGLSEAVLHGLGTEALVTAVVVGRLAATWACARGIPAARLDGLGATVAGTVSRTAALLLTFVVATLGVGYSRFVDDDASARNAVLAGGGVVLGLGLAALVLWRCVRRFGGITGDVLGAVVEISTLGVLLVMAR